MNTPSPSSMPWSADTAMLMQQHHADPHALVQILRQLQASHGWLPRLALQQIAQALGLTLAHVEGVAGFYRFFHTQPVGQYRVLFSDNVTDRMLGSEALLQQLCRLLKVLPKQLRAQARAATPLG